MMRPALLLSLLAALPLAHAAPDLTTVSERSGFQATGRYDEVVKLCGEFQKAYPKAVRCFSFGTTPEGRPMLALAVSRTGALTAKAAKALDERAAELTAWFGGEVVRSIYQSPLAREAAASR